MKTSLTLLTLWLLTTITIAQPTIQDCLGAIPVCQDFYSEINSPEGEGSFPNEAPFAACTQGESNSIWYVFTVNEDGLLGFLITPNDLNDDYDWALFDITSVDCGNLSINDIVSCNAAGDEAWHGITGCLINGIGNNAPFGCNNGNSPLNELVPMQAGNTYTLMVNNWTGSTNGYTLDFSGSSGLGIFDEIPPLLADFPLLPQSCGDQSIQLETSEFLQCASVQNTDFELLGPGGPYTLEVNSADCNIGSEKSKFFDLTITPPLQSMGDFTLNISAIADDHLLDLCDNQMEDYSFDFLVDVPIPVDINIGQDTSLLCAGDEIILDVSNHGFNFLWGDGSNASTITVNNEGIYNVTITNECGSGSDQIEVFVQQQPPMVNLGADLLLCPGDDIMLNADNGIAFYNWQNGSTANSFFVNTTGDYAVTVTNGCGMDQDEINITYIPPLNLQLANEYILCSGDTLSLDIERPFANYLWSDGNIAPQRIFLEDGNFSLTVSTQCETYETSFNVFFLVDSILNLGEDLTLCPNDTLVLSPNIPGATYTWQDGSSIDSFIVIQAGSYTVSATTNCNNLIDSINIDYLPSIAINLGRDTFLCPDDPFLLDASTVVLADFQWENNHKEARRPILGPGEYTVTVTSACEVVVDTIQIDECEICDIYLPNIFSPNYDGVNDRFYPQSHCAIDDYQMNIFDRWGNQVFTTTSPNQNMGWNGKTKGKLAPQGTYVWFIEYAVTENGYAHKRQLQGSIMLIR